MRTTSRLTGMILGIVFFLLALRHLIIAMAIVFERLALQYADHSVGLLLVLAVVLAVAGTVIIKTTY